MNFSFIKPQLRYDAFREYTFALCSYQVWRVSDVLFVPENKGDIWWDFNELEEYKLVVALEHSRVFAIFCSMVFTSDHLCIESKQCTLNTWVVWNSLKWKLRYKKSRILASARMPPLVDIVLTDVGVRVISVVINWYISFSRWKKPSSVWRRPW